MEALRCGIFPLHLWTRSLLRRFFCVLFYCYLGVMIYIWIKTTHQIYISQYLIQINTARTINPCIISGLHQLNIFEAFKKYLSQIEINIHIFKIPELILCFSLHLWEKPICIQKAGSFTTFLFSIYYVPDTVSGTYGRAENKTNIFPALKNLVSQQRI